jgi:beta-glucosidase
MIRRILIGAVILITVTANAQQNTAKMNSFITGLMSKMTLDEKLGQLNLPGSGDIVT